MKKIPAVLVVGVILALTGCASGQVRAVSPRVEGRAPHRSHETAEIAALFDRWNRALQTGDPRRVAALYAERSILLPTVSNKPRLTPAEKEEYFTHFLAKGPSARIDLRQITRDGDMAVDSGLYTFTFAKTGEVVSGRYTFTYQWNGTDWLIVSHHSSVMPEPAIGERGNDGN